MPVCQNQMQDSVAKAEEVSNSNGGEKRENKAAQESSNPSFDDIWTHISKQF